MKKPVTKQTKAVTKKPAKKKATAKKSSTRSRKSNDLGKGKAEVSPETSKKPGGPVGNQFWKARSKHGRDKIFSSPAILWEACQEYFEWVERNPLWETKGFAFQGVVTHEVFPKMRAMTIGGLCIFLDIVEETWRLYRKNNDFIGVVTQVEQIIRDQKFSGAAADLLNANIIARDLGLKDSHEVGGEGGGPIRHKIDHAVGIQFDRIREKVEAETGK